MVTVECQEPLEATDQASGTVNPYGSRHAVDAGRVMGLQQFFLTQSSVRPLPTGHRVEMKESWSLETSLGETGLRDVECANQGCTGRISSRLGCPLAKRSGVGA